MKNFARLASSLILAATLAACADFGSGVRVTSYQSGERWLDARFYSIEHPFTEAGAERARARAEQLCGDRGLTAIQAERACTASECTTNYQCVKAGDAKDYGLK